MFGMKRARILDFLKTFGESSSKTLIQDARIGVSSFYTVILKLEKEGLVVHRRGKVQRTFNGDRVFYYYRLPHQSPEAYNK